MAGYRHVNFESCAASRIGDHGQLAAERADALFDHERALTRRLELRVRFATGERESPPVVLDRELAAAVLRGEADEHVRRAAVAPDVPERFAPDARQLAARARR